MPILSPVNILHLAIALAAYSFPCAANPSTLSLQPSISKELDATGLRYSVDKDGDYVIPLQWVGTERRNQVVYVSSTSGAVGEVGFRRVYSFAAKGAKLDGRATPIKLLRENAWMKVGGWAVFGDSIIFLIHLRDNASPQELKEAILAAAHSADDFEIELNGDADLL